MWNPFKKEESDTIEVGWVSLANLFPLSVVFAPEPFRYETDLKAPEYLRCPAVQDFTTNLYTIRTPIDFQVSYQGDGILIETNPAQYVETLHKNLLTDARMRGDHIIQMPMDIGFVSDTQDVMVEILPTPLGRYEGHSFVVGRLNCHDWPARSLSASFDWYDLGQPISYKRGDAVFCVRLVHPSKKKIVLKQAVMNENLRKVLYDIDLIRRGWTRGTRAMMSNYGKLRRKKLLEWA